MWTPPARRPPTHFPRRMLPGQGQHDTRRVCPAWEPDPPFPRHLSPEADGDNTHLPGRREALGGGEVGQGVLFLATCSAWHGRVQSTEAKEGWAVPRRAVAGCSEVGGMGPRPGNASHSKVHRGSCLSTPVSSRPGQGSPQPATKVLTFPPFLPLRSLTTWTGQLSPGPYGPSKGHASLLVT